MTRALDALIASISTDERTPDKSTAETILLRSMYNREIAAAQMEGESLPSFEEWVKTQRSKNQGE